MLNVMGLGKLLLTVLLLMAASAHASMGLIELPADEHAGPVTLLYPTDAPETVVTRGPFHFQAAENATPSAGNAHLIVISHGSPAPVWVYLDLSRALVDAGFTVAMPEHLHDNPHDSSEPGPPSWQRRPFEISAAIDRLQGDARFAQNINFKSVGMYGMSAGGHTALTLAGGRWSPSLLRTHCQNFLTEDFHACAGPSLSLTGGILDGIKKFAVRTVDNWKFADSTFYGHTDSRITTIVAGVPFAADFDLTSLQSPHVALGLITARQDTWLNPRFHSDAILAACKTCVLVMDIKNGGHGALLSPLPPTAHFDTSLIADPPDFDRATEMPRINAAIVSFFQQHLLGSQPVETQTHRQPVK